MTLKLTSVKIEDDLHRRFKMLYLNGNGLTLKEFVHRAVLKFITDSEFRHEMLSSTGSIY